MNSFRPILGFILLLSWATACQEGNGDSKNARGSERTLPGSHGSPLDLLVVCPENMWDSKPGDHFRMHFTEMQYGLPQPEPRFKVRQVAPHEHSEILRRSRHQVIMSLGDSTGLRYEEEPFARGQMVIYLSAPDSEALAKLVDEKEGEMREKFRRRDQQRLYAKMKESLRKDPDPVYESHGVRLKVPQEFDLEKTQENLLFYWKKTNLSDQGIMVHFRPFPEGQDLMNIDLISLRDSLTKIYVPGERPGSYMVTETLIRPQVQPWEIDGQFAQEVRGLWTMEGDILGGPFVSYIVFDERNEQIIFLDGFIFAPDKKKRIMLLELEAILNSLKIQG